MGGEESEEIANFIYDWSKNARLANTAIPEVSSSPFVRWVLAVIVTISPFLLPGSPMSRKPSST